MAVKKSKKVEVTPIVEKVTEKKTVVSSKWMTVGWTLLLLGGLAHMMPTQMEPVLKWSMWGITLQTIVGGASVVAALYYLLED